MSIRKRHRGEENAAEVIDGHPPPLVGHQGENRLHSQWAFSVPLLG
jgi:hypothetical protein